MSFRGYTLGLAFGLTHKHQTRRERIVKDTLAYYKYS
jgi:hypothetical protein